VQAARVEGGTMSTGRRPWQAVLDAAKLMPRDELVAGDPAGA
jgi:hypothetical protein